MDPVTHFELPGEDMERMKKFYQTAFGWQMQQMGPEMGNYILAHTTETDKDGMVKTPGNINGGFYKKKGSDQNARLTIAVKDIKKAMEAITAAGGKVLGGMQNPGQPDEIPGVGLYATFIDSEGNHASILQPFKM